MSSPNGPLPHPHPHWCRLGWCNTARGGPHRGERYALEDVGSSPMVVQVEQVDEHPAELVAAFLRPVLFTVTFTLPGATEVGEMLRGLAAEAGLVPPVGGRVGNEVTGWAAGR